MVEIDVRYLGGLRCEATHGPSGQTLITDAPQDNHGKGEFFSPTDLVVTAMGTCVFTIMGICAEREGIPLQGARVRVSKTMSSDAPRRIARCEMVFEMPRGIRPEHRGMLERIVKTCPVQASLKPEVEIRVVFHWDSDRSAAEDGPLRR